MTLFVCLHPFRFAYSETFPKPPHPSSLKRHRMVPLSRELEVVRQILDLWRRGLSYRGIVATLSFIDHSIPSGYESRVAFWAAH